MKISFEYQLQESPSAPIHEGKWLPHSREGSIEDMTAQFHALTAQEESGRAIRNVRLYESSDGEWIQVLPNQTVEALDQSPSSM